MGRTTLKIILSLVFAGAAGFGVLLALEALLPSQGHSRDAVLFRFQLSSMIAMAVFAGLAIVIFVRLSRRG
jgi:hypothetical protein